MAQPVDMYYDIMSYNTVYVSCIYRRNTTLSPLDERTWLWLDTVPLPTQKHSGRVDEHHHLQTKFKIRHATPDLSVII